MLLSVGHISDGHGNGIGGGGGSIASTYLPFLWQGVLLLS